MASDLATFELRDHLDHCWTDELVGFPLPPDARGQRLAIADEQNRRQPCQVHPEADGDRVYFTVDELPARGERTFRLLPLAAGETVTEQPPTVSRSEAGLELSNGDLTVRVPGEWARGTPVPTPVLAVRRGAGPWLGQGRFFLSPHLELAALESQAVAHGPLWVTWGLVYRCTTGEEYRVTVTVYAHGAWAEIREESRLCRDSRWEWSLQPGLAPDHFWTHRHTLRPLDFPGAAERTNLGSIQLPVYSGIWVPDDYYYVGLLNRTGGTPDCVALLGINGGSWDYPYENQIDLERTPAGDAFFRFSIKAGHRAWVLLVTDGEAVVSTQPPHQNPLQRLMRKYETPLHKVKDYVLEWDDVPDAQRPFALADRAQLAETQAIAGAYRPLRDYVASLNPDLPGDYTYYHSGTHRVFTPECRNDPAVLYVMAATADERRKQARFLKDVVLTGLAHRRKAMLDQMGHVDADCSSINLGRGLRPWAALYDFAAAEGVFSPAEQRLARATFAFFCYQIADPDFWPADHLIKRDDHPRSAHRTHWFPGRHSDWAFYNIDNIPHNFHGDLWSALGCTAMVFPTHPCSRGWVELTLGWWEAELTWWVFPEGAWLESSTYTLNSMKDYLIYCRMLANARWRDYFTDERLQRVFRFIAEALGPYDARLGGTSLPVIGDGSYPNGFGYVLGWMAGLCRERAPEFAQRMSHAWKTTGEYLTEPGRFGLNFCDFLFLDPRLPARASPPLSSKWYHGLGAILRHAHGTPDEIYLFIKAGIIYSHFHEPEGTFQLWWNSAPLCDEYGVQYGKATDGTPLWHPKCHNCVEVQGDNCCYNKGDLTTFITGPVFDYVVVEAPILQAYLPPGGWIWGHRGEMGPAGWHRRLFLLVKPRYLYVYDDLECAHPTTWHLNVKADACRQDGNRVHYDGRLGTDLEVVMLNAGTRPLQHGELDTTLSYSSSFQPPPKFFHQLQLHVPGAPGEPYVSVLVPHRRELPASVANDPATGGARITFGAATERAMLFPQTREIQSEQVVFRGTAGAVREEGDELVLLLAAGNRIGRPGRLEMDGDGPFTATLNGGQLRLDTQGVGRWLTIRGPAFTQAAAAGAALPFEKLGDRTIRLYVPPEHQSITLT